MSRWFSMVLSVTLATNAFAALRFTNAVTVAGGAPVFFADLNGDGRIDLIAGSQVYVQRTNGTLMGTTSFPSSPPSSQIVTGDFNGDGRLDMVRLYDVWLGNGDGTFTAHGGVVFSSYASDYNHMRAADCNRDGKLDLVVFADRILQVWLGDGTGGFSPAPGSNFIDHTWGRLDMADFNRDGVLDVALFQGESFQSNTVLVLTGKGDGTFTNVTSYARNGYDRAFIQVADLNLDDVPDVVVAGLYLPQAQVFLGESNGLADAKSSGWNSGSPFHLADVNGDGYLDELKIGYLGLYVSLGLGNGYFTNEPIFALPVTNYLTGDFTVGDFNGDLKTDIAFVDGTTVTVATNFSDLPASAPQLALRSRAPDVLSWPIVSNGFFALEFRQAFHTNVPWLVVSNAAVRRGGNFYVTNTPAVPRGFYRLRRF